MEGFLLKKGRGESKIFGRRNWKKRWFILEGQYLTYYEDFDRQNNRPVRQKGVAVVRGCDIRQIPHQEKKFCFIVKHEQRRPIYLCADKEKLMFIWIDALTKAAKGVVRGPASINWDEYYEILNMPNGEEYTLNSLNKAYRKAALKTHPDKGGNVDLFKKVQEAFEMLQSKYEEEEQNKHYRIISFSAKIVKCPPPVGFGMVVAEDPKRGGIVIKDVHDSIHVDWIAPEAEGSLQKGDLIVQVESEVIRSWSLARLSQRLTEFRAPLGSIVTFTFERRVRIGGEPETNDDFGEPNQTEGSMGTRESTNGVDEPYQSSSSPPPSSPLSSSRPSSSHQPRLSITFQDFPNNEENEEDAEEKSDFFERKSDADVVQNNEGDEHDHHHRHHHHHPHHGETSDPRVTTLQKEVEKLKNELQRITEQRDNYRDELDDLRMKMEITIGERNEFLRQLGEAEMECQDLERRERDALALVEQMAELQVISAKQSARIENNVQMAVSAIQSGHLTSQVEDSESFPGSVEHARQSALTAAALVDPDGRFSGHSSENSGNGFLQRLENSVLKPYCDSAPALSPPAIPPREEPALPPPPTLSLPQRLMNSRNARQTGSDLSSPQQQPHQQPQQQQAQQQAQQQQSLSSESKPSSAAGKRESNFHQINKRVVSGLYIDSLRNESPKKSLIEKLQRSPPLQQQQQQQQQQQFPSPNSPDRRLKLDRSLSQPATSRISSPQKVQQFNSPHVRPSRPPPPSPALSSSESTSSTWSGSGTGTGTRSSRTPNRREAAEMYSKSGGANRGPQYYRDLLLASKDKSPPQSSHSERFRSDTTTESYLYSSSSSSSHTAPPLSPGSQEKRIYSGTGVAGSRRGDQRDLSHSPRMSSYASNTTTTPTTIKNSSSYGSPHSPSYPYRTQER